MRNTREAALDPTPHSGSRGLLFLLMVILSVVALTAAACGGDDDDDDTGDGNGETPTEEPTESGDNGDEEPTEPADDGNGDGNGGGGGTIEMGYVAGWPEGVASTFLWAHLLEEEGYTVETTPLDAGLLYEALDTGDVHMYTDAWLPATHGQYMTDNINELVTWYEQAGLYLTVPSYVDATSLEDLSGMADEFDSTITGIEPGAGMMATARDSVMPAYGLEDWTLLESSTPAMLAELDSAIANEEPIVVTLWSPGWWYNAYDLTNLEDPEGAWGDPEHISVVTTSGFAEDFPEVAGWLENFEMTDPQIAGLISVGLNDNNEFDMSPENVEEWLSESENQELVDSWLQ
ncbi:MAG: glycine betaine ABC transporter substrate-binding protein [Dehalococcoidia bacterium]|nr:glycine betaine ABC transporter substrate-binding protein [Dehalococcoidia bacterium]